MSFLTVRRKVDLLGFFKTNKPIINELKKTVNAQHNSQLTATQLNSRFRETGYEGASGEDKVFHKCVALLPIVRFPFVVYFFGSSKESVGRKVLNLKPLTHIPTHRLSKMQRLRAAWICG